MSNWSTRKRQKSRNSSHRIVRKKFSSSDDEEPLALPLSTKDVRLSGLKQEANDESGSELDHEESSSGNLNLGLKTPRSSSRVMEKARRSFTLPSRESVLEEISPAGCKSFEKARKYRPRRLINNFVRG